MIPLLTFDTFFSYDVIKSKKWKVSPYLHTKSAEGLWQIRCLLQHPVVNKALVPSGSCMPWFGKVKTRVATSNLTILHQNMKYESTYSTMVSVCQSAPQNEDPVPSPLCFGLEQMVPRNGVVVTPRCHQVPWYRCHTPSHVLHLPFSVCKSNGPKENRNPSVVQIWSRNPSHKLQ